MLFVILGIPGQFPPLGWNQNCLTSVTLPVPMGTIVLQIKEKAKLVSLCSPKHHHVRKRSSLQMGGHPGDPTVWWG